MAAAEIALSEKRYDEAARNLETALVEATQFDPTDPRLRQTLSALASAYEHQKRYQDAAATYRRLLSAPEGTDEWSKSVRHLTIDNLALVEERLGNLDESEKILKYAIDYQRSSTDVDGPPVLEIVALAKFYQRHGRYELASATYDSALKELGNDPCRASARFDISRDKAMGLLARADLSETPQNLRAMLLAEAEKIGRERLAWLDVPDNVNSYELAEALDWYASILRRMQREQDAIKLENRADSIQARFRLDHPQDQGFSNFRDPGCSPR